MRLDKVLPGLPINIFILRGVYDEEIINMQRMEYKSFTVDDYTIRILEDYEGIEIKEKQKK